MESGSLELSEITLKRKDECEELRDEIFRHGDEKTKQAVVAYVEAIRRYAKSCHREDVYKRQALLLLLVESPKLRLLLILTQTVL